MVEDAEFKDMNASAKVPSMKAALDVIAGHVAANGAGSVFVAGGAPSHVDTAIAAVLLSPVRILGKEHELCKEILGHEWAGKYIEAMSKWE